MQVGNIINALACSGDIGAEMAALAVQSGQAQKDVARASRDADEAMVEHEEDQEVQAMRQKADDVRSEALLDGIGTALEGAGMIGAGLSSTPQVGDRWQGAGKLAAAGMHIGGGGKGADASAADATAAQHKAAAEHAKSAAEDMHDAARDASDYVKTAVEFYRDYVSTEAESRAAALHRA